MASQAMEALAVPTAAIAMAIAETAHLLILYLWKINQELHFPSINHQMGSSIHSAQQSS